MHIFPTRRELHTAHKVIRHLTTPLVRLLEQLNKADSSNSLLPPNLSSHKSAYGNVQEALRAVVLEYYKLDLRECGDIKWSDYASWPDDFFEHLVEFLVEPGPKRGS